MMDACFGFPRKKSAGASIHAPRFEKNMFADQADVDNFVQKHSKEVKKSENVGKLFAETLLFIPTVKLQFGICELEYC